MPDPGPSALKEVFDEARFRRLAEDVACLYPGFDRKRFLSVALPGLAALTLLQRLRRMSESLHATLPTSYRKALAVLRKLAPRLDRGLVALVLPDYVGEYVGEYGGEEFDVSMEALKFFTTFGSSEFGVRPFLRRDLSRALRFMEVWALDENEHVRRLASEGSRPRLPWSFRLDALVKDPRPTAPIIEALKADPSLYVRKSVANHLNDITKDHREWVLERINGWDLTDPRTAWIAKRALRTLIKKGDRDALAVIGAAGKAEVVLQKLTIAPRKVRLGERISVSFDLASTSAKPQRLVVDYIVHYVKKSGATTAKVFKLKELTLEPRRTISLVRSQSIRDYTTRNHHPGRHEVEIVINGERLGRDYFQLSR